MTAITPSSYRRADGVAVEAIQSIGETQATLDLCAWIPSDKLRLEDMAGTPAMYVFTIGGGYERVWLRDWVVRYQNGGLEVWNNTAFPEIFTPVDDEPAPEPAEVIEDGHVVLESGESIDLEHDGAMLAALSTGQGDAINAAGYWAELADTLTKVRAQAAGHLPATPESLEGGGYNTRVPGLPFVLIDLRMELAALSGLITKAHTLAAIYTREAHRLDDEYAAVAPD